MDTLDILDPITELKLGDETVKVRELRWVEFLTFLSKLAEQASRFVKGNTLQIAPEQIEEMITQSTELTELLILNSTSRDKKWLDQRSFAEVLLILDAALSVNMSSEVLGRVKKVGGRLKSALGVKAAVSTSNSAQ